jgi:hypothetical protein
MHTDSVLDPFERRRMLDATRNRSTWYHRAAPAVVPLTSIRCSICHFLGHSKENCPERASSTVRAAIRAGRGADVRFETKEDDEDPYKINLRMKSANGLMQSELREAGPDDLASDCILYIMPAKPGTIFVIK